MFYHSIYVASSVGHNTVLLMDLEDYGKYFSVFILNHLEPISLTCVVVNNMFYVLGLPFTFLSFSFQSVKSIFDLF